MATSKKPAAKKTAKVGAAKTAAKKAATPKVKDEAAEKEQLLARIGEMKAELDFDREYTMEDSLEDLRAAVADGEKALKDESGEGDEPEVHEDKKDLEDADSVDVVSGPTENRKYVRTFTAERHGDDFMEVAKEFVAKHGGELVPSSSVKGLKVRWEQKDEETGVVAPKFEFFRGTSHEVKQEALNKTRTVLGTVTVMTDDELKKLSKKR